jgi:hypothetical protein
MNFKNKFQDEKLLKNHPLFKDRKIRSQKELKELFQATFSLYTSVIEEEVCDELETYDEGDISDDAGNEIRSKKDCCNEKSKKKNETNHEKNIDEEEYDEEVAQEVSLDITTEYASLFLVMRLYKIFEHVLLRAYILEHHVLEVETMHDIDFDKVITFLKKQHIIVSEEEENGIYFLQLLVNAIEESFLFKSSGAFEDSLLSDDTYLFCDVDQGTVYQTVANLSRIMEKL